MKEHNYEKKLKEAGISMKQVRAYYLRPGNILHDSTCHIYQGEYCDCDPDITKVIALVKEEK